MQAWQSVLCINEASAWHAQAGTVVRSELVRKDGDEMTLVHVRMDHDGSTQSFTPDELRVL